MGIYSEGVLISNKRGADGVFFTSWIFGKNEISLDVARDFD